MRTATNCVLLGLMLITASCRKYGPGDTYTTALMAANAGNYAEANHYLNSNLRDAISGMGTMAGRFNQVWDERTKNRTIQSIDVVKQEVQGDQATLTCNIQYQDGSVVQNDKVKMKKEEGTWRLML